MYTLNGIQPIFNFDCMYVSMYEYFKWYHNYLQLWLDVCMYELMSEPERRCFLVRWVVD